jgi:DNA polymerase-3 subunit delta'
MIDNGEFIGNAKVVRYLDKALEKSFVSHAYLFEGPAGVGKTTLALRFASELLDESYERVRKNPDLLFITVQDDESQIDVDAIRTLQKDLSLYPFKSRYKVAIIEKAEFMNRTAANSLLKTLEEPGKTSVLILLSSDTGKLLDTIKSRCQTISLNPVSSVEMEARLTGKNAKEAIRLAQGRPGVAISLLEDAELFQETETTSGQVLDLLDADNFQRMQQAATVGALDKREAARVLDLWTTTLRQELTKNLGRDVARTTKIRAAIEKTMTTKEDILSTSVNLRLAIENLCLSF